MMTFFMRECIAIFSFYFQKLWRETIKESIKIMSVSAKVLNTGNFNTALNLVPRQVRFPRKCPDVAETLQERTASPPPPVQSNPEPGQTKEVVPVNLREVELQPRPYQVGPVPHNSPILMLFSSL